MVHAFVYRENPRQSRMEWLLKRNRARVSADTHGPLLGDETASPADNSMNQFENMSQERERRFVVSTIIHFVKVLQILK